MLEPLSKKQKEIFDYICTEVQNKGYPPSVREICNAVGLKSTSTVHSHLNKLEEKEYIRRDPTKPRTIEIISQQYDSQISENFNRPTSIVPIIGEVAAGQPILATENIIDTLPMPSEIVDNGNYFFLQIKGESMIEAGILDRDYVLVREQPIANNGDMVIALLDDSATCKTFYKESDRIRLQPENSFMEPIYTRDVRILGIVKAVFRKL